MRKLASLSQGLVALFYPNLCLVCHQNIAANTENPFCFSCEFKLPQTQYHLEKDNPFLARFWGRIPVHTGAALYLYGKGTKTQQLIHQLKYHGKKEIGWQLGKLYGRQLKEAHSFNHIDIIVPVPLHPKKEKKRGYNQSDYFAKGLSETLGKPWLKNGLERSIYTTSQTKKERMERFENVIKAFEVNREKKLQGKHILLVDDVLTTGATLEACATKVLNVPETKVSMATIAIAQL